MNFAAQPNITYMDQYIEDSKKNTLSLKNLYSTLLVKDSNTDHYFRIPWNDFFLKYRTELKPALQYYQISQNLFYKPKTLSLELYGVVDLWLALLRANNMKSVTEFHKPIIVIYAPGKLEELITIFFKRDKIIGY